MGGQGETGGFEPFVDVRVVEDEAFEAAFLITGGPLEVTQPASSFEEVVLRGESDHAVLFEARREKGISKLDIGDGEWLELHVGGVKEVSDGNIHRGTSFRQRYETVVF
jgi:hypothetical protein